MSKNERKLFATALLITLLFFGFIMALLLVDARENNRRGGGGEELFSMAREGPKIQLQLLGREVRLDLEPLNEPARLRREYAPLLTSRSLLTLESAVDYAVYWGEQYYNQYKELIFEQETTGVSPEAASGSSTAS